MSYSDALARMATAASTFLATTGPAPHPAASQPFEDEEARRDWHYIPRERSGLALAAMPSYQQKAAYDLLASGLSLPTFAAATTIMALEDVLDELEGKRGPRPDRRQSWGRHRADYSVTVFGDPGDEGAWGWRFEGHHLSVNMAVVDGQAAWTPLFLGANPAELVGPSGQPVTRPLAAEEDLALALVGALPAALRSQVIIDDVAPDDILTGAEPLVVDPVEPPGVPLEAMPDDAAAIGRALVHLYVRRPADPLARRRWAQLEPHLDQVSFAFAGEPEHRRPHYYRFQGPRLLIEYDNTQNGANHVHTVVRDPLGDFGDDLLQAHRSRYHSAGP